MHWAIPGSKAVALLAGILALSWGQAAVAASEQSKLDNGLRVLVTENHDSPTVAVCITYAVGARDEAPGKSGLAHLVERLMFQGTRNLGPDDPYLLISGRGGKTQSKTTGDYTQFCSAASREQLPLLLWLEAERMKNLSATPAVFSAQRDLLIQELRAGASSAPHARGPGRLSELAYQDYWPYGHGAQGNADELGKLEPGDASDFHWRHYSPNNAVLSIVGDVVPEGVLQLTREHFGRIDDRELAPRPNAPEHEFRQSSERLSVIVEPNCTAPGVFYGYRVPNVSSKDHATLLLLTALLGDGQTARLTHSLIAQRSRALRTEVWLADNQLSELLGIYVAVAPLSSVDKVQEVVEGELKRLRFTGPSDDELGKAKARLHNDALQRLASPGERAAALGRAAVLGLPSSEPESELAAIEEVSAAQVQKLAASYLLDNKRSIVEIYPPGWAQDEAPLVVVVKHTVKRGDNLETIARTYGSSVAEISKASGIDPGKPIFPGQVLKVPVVGGVKKPPAPRVHTVKKGDSLSVIAQRYGTHVADIVKLNKINPKKAIIVGQKLTIPPKDDGDDKSKGASKKKGK